MRARLLAAGARPGFSGLMLDRRFDRDGVLLARDEVLRLRTYRDPNGAETNWIGWKGPTGITREGYKERRELEYRLEGKTPPDALLEALGYRVSLRIDRRVEYFELERASVRLEWYPRMDVLMEVEGDPQGIETALTACGLPRSAYSAESLTAFADRYQQRTGRPARLAQDPGEPASWEPR